jgi:diketogulonate reductase-like aldo/keto reductase
MRHRDFGPTKRQIAVIGQGTWNLERGGRSEAVEALRQGLDAGMTHIDTAEMYGGGRVEEIVGEAIAGRRDEVFLVSKVLPQNASRRGVIQACERSLAHLRTDRLDIYLLHWPSRYPLEDTFAAFEDLAQAGKIAAWGVSNFDVKDLERSVRIAGPRKIACNQVLYHLEERAIEPAVLPFCEQHGIAVVAYSPFGSGRFPSPRSRGGQVLGEIAEAHGATPHQIALAFLTRLPPLFAIPKASQARHALDNAAAGDLELTADEIARLDDAFPVGSRRELPTL